MASKIEMLEQMAEELTLKIAAMSATIPERKLTFAMQWAAQCGNSTNPLVAGGPGDYYLNSCVASGGDTSFMILSSAIVLLMTIPGLGLYYSGMVKVTNVLATVMQSFSITCLVTFLWLCFTYSLAFGNPDATKWTSPFIGDGERGWLLGIEPISTHRLAGSIPESVYCVFQLTFAIITAALICGSFADRMKYSSMLIFIGLWHVGVYCPIAHANWHPDGFLYQAGVMDFAGGNVVHISSGVAGLMSTIVVGNRHGFGKERFEPHNILLTFIGASMLWGGWFGFNAGSAINANAMAGQAALNTQIATACAALSWMTTEWIIKKKPGVLGILSGSIAGLVAITPCCGWVDATGAFFIGLFAGPWCYAGAQIKHYAGYDDALDAFGVHATGGLLGAIMNGFMSNPRVWAPYQTPQGYDGNGNAYVGYNNQKYYAGIIYHTYSTVDDTAGEQLWIQLYASCSCIVYSALASFTLLKAIDLTIGLRVTEEEEAAGLDSSLHGESIVAKIEK
jgi:Amt family ammonium transporter